MNQESFSIYKQQVYNPGSPQPNPKVSPLKSLRKEHNYNFLTVNPENPLKLVFSASKRKASTDSEPSVGPRKIAKTITPDDVKAMTQEVVRQIREGQD